MNADPNTALDRLIQASRIASSQLQQAELGSMVSRSQFDVVAERALIIAEASGVINDEKLDALQAALADAELRRDFAIALNGLLHGKRSLEERFGHFVKVLAPWGLASWPMVSLWPALCHPDRYMPVDGGWWPAAAEPCPPLPDWAGYRESQREAHRLRKTRPSEDLLALFVAACRPSGSGQD